MTKKIQIAAIAILAVLLCVSCALVFVFFANADVVRADGDNGLQETTVGAVAYYSQTADGEQTKLGEYDDFKSTIDAVVDFNAELLSEGASGFYTVEVLSDSKVTWSSATAYPSSGGVYAGNDQTTGVLIAGDMDITVNGNGHQVVIEGAMRAMRIRGESHVVMNDLEIIGLYKGEMKGLELRGGNLDVELNQVIVQVSSYGNSQALCFGGAGFNTDEEGNRVITTAKLVAKNCSFGTPVDGKQINGKDVVNYFDKDGDGVADDSKWPIPTSHYGILSFVKIDLTLDNSTSGGFAAMYLKAGDSSTGSRNSVIKITNGSYLRGLNVNTSISNMFGAIVLERPYSGVLYYDYDNDGLVDCSGNGNTVFTDENGTQTTLGDHYIKTSNIKIDVVNSTIESTTTNKNTPANQYCFLFQTMGNDISVSGDSVLTTDDQYRSNPTKAVYDHYYGDNTVSITGGTLYKWDELPASYIKSDAAVGDKLYATLADAVLNADDGDTVSLIHNITVSSNDVAALVQNGKNITINLNNKTITVSASDANVAAIENNGVLRLVNGTIERAYDSANGTLIVNNGELVLADLYVIDRTSGSNALIANGVSARTAVNADLTIESGVYVSAGGNVVENAVGAVIMVYGGSLESRALNGAALLNNGVAEINGGAFKADKALIISKAGGAAETVINGGTFKGAIEINDITSGNLVAIGGGTFDLSAKDSVLPYVVENRKIVETQTTITVAKFLVKTDIVYTGKEYTVGVGLNDLLQDNSIKITADMTVAITKYLDADGNEADIPEIVKNAGTYVISIETDSDAFEEIEIVIARAKVSLDEAVFSVVKSDDTNVNVALESMTIVEVEGRYLPCTAGTANAIMVINSVIRSSMFNSSVTIGITGGIDLSVCTVTLIGNTNGAAGRYVAVATVTVDPNYAVNEFNVAELNRRGIVITDNGDGTYEISKTWYIVNMSNWLIGADGDYVVGDGHVFGQTPEIPMPLLYSDIPAPGEGVDNADSIYMSLYYNGVPVSVDFRRNLFDYYINDSMPVGNYTFVVECANTFTNTYEYTVYPARVNQTALDNFLNSLGAGIEGNTFVFEWDGYMHLLNEAATVYFNALKQNIAELTPDRKGCWLDNAYDNRYGDLTLTFNMDRMHNAVYYSENTMAGLSVRPDSPDRYTIYYMLSAENFEPLLNLDANAANYDSARREYVFYVVIVRGLDIPDIAHATYNGSEIKADIVGNEYYLVENYAGFTEGGTHSITLRIREPEYYYWKGHNLGEASVSVEFVIDKADNEWIRVPNIVNWTYETFDTQINRIRAVVKFLDEGQTVKFAITKADGTAVSGLGIFTVNDDGTVDNQILIKALNGLKVGAYKLVVTVDGTDNYNKLSQSVDFVIGKAINVWADGEDDLVLPNWIVGTFNLDENAIVVKAAHGQAIVEIRDIDGNVYYNSTKPDENTLNTLDVGKYLLVAWVNESEDYAALAERTFTIEVLDKIGLPWWGTLGITVGALALAAAIILILWKFKVFEILTDKISLAITTRATVDATIAAVRATKTAEEADAHKRKVEARERLEAAREAERSKTPEQKAQELQVKAEVTATKANKMQEKASKMRERADKLAGKTEQQKTVDEQPDVKAEDSDVE